MLRLLFSAVLVWIIPLQGFADPIDRNLFFKELKRSFLELPENLQTACRKNLESDIENATQAGLKISEAIRWDDETLLFRGQVTFEYLWQLEKIEAPIKTIALELPHGGSAIASLFIAKKIRELGLNTFSGLTWCHSACTVLFQGGKERIIDPKGLLTYHGVIINSNEQSGQCLHEINLYLKETLADLDFPLRNWGWFRHPAYVNPVFPRSLVEEGIATKVERLRIGNDDYHIERSQTPDYCDRNPDDEDC